MAEKEGGVEISIKERISFKELTKYIKKDLKES